MPKNESIQGTLGILFATLFWGMTFAFIKDAVSTLSPFNFLFWRFGIASILMLLIFWKKIKFNTTIFSHGIFLGIFLAGTVVFQTIGLQYTPASTASFITGLAVILVALFESLLIKQFPSKYLITSTLLAIVGIGLISLGNGLSINQGDVWVLLCAFCFANYIILAGKASHIEEPLSLTFIQAFCVCIIAGTACLITETMHIPLHVHVWVSILFCSIFASIVAFILQLKFQKLVSATKAAIIFSLEPVFATITAAIYLHEHLSLRFLVGALLIFMAILLSEKSTKQKVIPQE